ncbi:hypothetical protein PflCFBP13517_25535 [Pseudomonas fluorescens]|nr:hypothetical protein PflCFBP13517_25535 [Pseudomonas fluorescens]
MLSVSKGSESVRVQLVIRETRRAGSGVIAKLLRVKNNYIEIRDEVAQKTMFIRRDGIFRDVYKAAASDLKNLNLDKTNSYGIAFKNYGEFLAKEGGVAKIAKRQLEERIAKDPHFSKQFVSLSDISRKIAGEVINESISHEIRAHRVNNSPRVQKV